MNTLSYKPLSEMTIHDANFNGIKTGDWLTIKNTKTGEEVCGYATTRKGNAWYGIMDSTTPEYLLVHRNGDVTITLSRVQLPRR
jgi:hypothetical protein